MGRNRNQIFITEEKWKNIKEDIKRDENVLRKKSPKLSSYQIHAKTTSEDEEEVYVRKYDDNEREEILKRARDYIGKKEKSYYNLNRAKFLSQVFYERENQMKFENNLKQLEVDKKQKSIQIRKKQEHLLTKNTNEELTKKMKEKEIRRREELMLLQKKQDEEKREREGAVRVEREHQKVVQEEIQNSIINSRKKAMEEKQRLLEILKYQIKQKEEETQFRIRLEKEEEKLNACKLKLKDEIDQIKRQTENKEKKKKYHQLKKINQRRPTENKQKECPNESYRPLFGTIKRISDTKDIKEYNRRMMLDELKEKMEERAKEIEEESNQRKNNLYVTEAYVKSCRDRKYDDMIKLNKFLDRQAELKKETLDRNKDKKLARSSQMKIEEENQKFIELAKSAIYENKNANKPVIPIIKCLNEYKRENLLKPFKTRNQVWISNIEFK